MSASPLAELTARRTELRRKLRARETVFSAWQSLAHPSITEAFCRMGVDAVGIDVEHSTISQGQVQRIVAAAQAGGALCLPRIASHNAEAARRMLDSGADGIIVPNIASAEQAEAAASWVKYPPEGKRGFGVSRAQGYGHDFDEYVAAWNASSTLIVQIESIAAVDAVDEILAVEAVDGVMVGPYDISGSLGIPGQIDHERVREAGAQVVDACKRAGKACGTQLTDPDAASIDAALADGFTFIVLASDVFLLWKWGARMGELVENARRS